MKLFNENGEEYNLTEFFDEDGKLIGGFFENTKDNISEAFDTSWLLGLLLLIISPIWGIIFISLILLFKLFVLLIRTLWWIIKLPFCLIFHKNLPKF